MFILANKTQVSNKSMNYIILKRGKWKVDMCRYAERYQCACEFVGCQDYNNKNNTRSRQLNTVIAQRLQNMFNQLLKEHTFEVQCVVNPLVYHKLEYLNMSNFAHIWISSWKNK